MTVALRPYMIAGDGSQLAREGDPGAHVVAYDVIGLSNGRAGSIWSVHEKLHRIRRGNGEWTGEYASKEDALADLQSELG